MAKPSIRLNANPIIIKELRSRMRGPRAFLILTLFLLLLGAVTYGLFGIVTASSGMLGGSAPMGAVIGRTLFTGLIFFELLLVCLISPALTAGTVSSEEERRTLDMLLATPLRSASILWGKLASALTYVFLLLLAAIPMASIVFLFGGVTAIDMLLAMAMLILCTITYGTLGLFFSAWLRRTGKATVASYIVILLLMFGSYFIYIFVGVTTRNAPSRLILVANPIAAMASAIGGDTQTDTMGMLAGPLMPVVWALGGAASGVRVVVGGQGNPTETLRPLWHYTAGIHTLTALALFLLSVQLLKPIRRWRLGRAGLAGLIGSILLLMAGSYAFYGPPSYVPLGYPVLATPTPAVSTLLSMPATIKAEPVMVQPTPTLEATSTPVVEK